MLPDFRQPQTVAASQFVTVIAQANAAGFRAIGVAVLPAGYRVTFERTGRLPHAECSKGSSAGVCRTGYRDRALELDTDKKSSFIFPC
jgi:hypothetical protein